MSDFITLITHKLFLAGFFAIIICQFLKMIIFSIKDKKFNLKHFFELSGIPSSHTATVVALTTMVYFLEGISNLFIVGIALTVYIIDEALTIEASVGKHSKLLNKLIKKLNLSDLSKIIPQPLRERWGHTYDEVIVGGVIGFLISWLINHYI